MTTTGMYSGLNEDNRNSSRVLRPPGGGSSNIFGNEPEAAPPRKTNPQQTSSIFGGGDEDRSSAQQAAAPAKPPSSATSHDKLFGDPSPQAQAAKPQGAYNPITGQAYANTSKPKTDSPPVPSTKVRQPPGGASSGLW